MNLNDFMEDVLRTAAKDFRSRSLANAALSLCEEAGEVAGPIKKHVFHGHKLSKEKVMDELGDVMFYAFWLSSLLDFSIEDVLKMNIKKRENRYPYGFSKEDSINRQDGILK